MCDICRQNPCNSRCPNADEPKRLATCCVCKDGITAGEKYWHIDGKDYCENCEDDYREYTDLKFMHYAEEDNMFDDDDFWED